MTEFMFYLLGAGLGLLLYASLNVDVLARLVNATLPGRGTAARTTAIVLAIYALHLFLSR